MSRFANVYMAMLVVGMLLPSYSYSQVKLNFNGSAPTSSRDVFPKLPTSESCKQSDLIGFWKLLMVYEVPSGREIDYYTSYPLQYYIFDADTRFGYYNGGLSSLSLSSVRNIAMKESGYLQQFVVNDGVVYFYRERVMVDRLACFIVKNNQPPFQAGQMILMPVKKDAVGRMIKVYDKVPADLEAACVPTKEEDNKVEQ